jgi:hypothetical protein
MAKMAKKKIFPTQMPKPATKKYEIHIDYAIL